MQRVRLPLQDIFSSGAGIRDSTSNTPQPEQDTHYGNHALGVE